MKQILYSGFIAGLLLLIFGYAGLYSAVKFFPGLFLEYNNPLFNSDGSRDILFYLHSFVISFALSWFWQRFKSLFHGSFVVRGLEFGCIYALVALLPVMWITFSALDVTFIMVASWFIYGLLQAVFAGLVFSKLNP